MGVMDVVQLALYALCLAIMTPFLGRFMARVFEGEKTLFSPVLGPLERLIYRLAGVNASQEMRAKDYAWSLVLFNILGFGVVFLLQLMQKCLPFNPQALPNASWHAALNTAISFMTNTNWQAYSGEASLSYLTQMMGLGVQNFLSAATGMAVLLVLIRGFVRQSGQTLGNFWVDMTRTTLYVLLPLSFIFAVILVGQGVVQNFEPYVTVKTLEGADQLIPTGPAASQVAIKQLGTNGGGFFGGNSAHPFENPTPLSNFLQMLAILLIPAAQVYMLGVMLRSRRQGFSILTAMVVLFCVGLALALYGEWSTNASLGMSGIMEGKEARFGVTNSVLWATATSAASNGSVNMMHSSLSPLAGFVAMFNMLLGEVIFGGVGAGLYGMLMFVLLTVFIAGLMVGRTPEYLGKKIEAREVTWAVVAIVVPSLLCLLGTALSCVLPQGVAGLSHKGPHGLSEILYAFASAAGNNGSAFAGLTVNTPFYNMILALVMLVGRFAVIFSVIAIAGNLVTKKIMPTSSGTFPTDSPLFGVLLVSVILIVAGLTFFPVLSLGPVMEHLLMLQGRVF